MSKTLKEHLEFIKKISIEDFLIKVISKKPLKKYISNLKIFDDN